jgi:hypothetical protein
MSLPLPPGKPFYVKPYIRSGRAHLALGRADAAREQFEMALQEISAAKAQRGGSGSGSDGDAATGTGTGKTATANAAAAAALPGADVRDDEESARKGLEQCRSYSHHCRAASIKLKSKEFTAGLQHALEAHAIALGSWEARCLVASAYVT